MSRERDKALLLEYLKWAHNNYDDERGWEGNADAFLASRKPGEPTEPDTTFARYARLVAACRKLRVVGGGECLFWDVTPDVIAEFDLALAACED